MTRTFLLMFTVLLLALSAFSADSHPPNPNYTAPEGEPLKGLRICVDPGHGGQTWGATRGYTGGTRSSVSDQTESDANLRVGMFLWDLLTQAGAQVVMTRTYETRLSDDCHAEPNSEEWKANRREELNIRVRVAEQNDCDLMLSIHHNAGGGPDTNFTCVFYYDPGEKEGALQSKETVELSKSLAETITKTLSARLDLKTRPARSGDYHVLRENSVPAVIIECAFMPNVEQAIWMEDLAYSRHAAIGIFEGVLEVVAKNKSMDEKTENVDAEKKPDADSSESKEEVKS